MITKLLEQLGLTKQEAKTYLTLLELGSVPAGLLIKRLGMHRAAVYNLLDLLINKGLVHYVKEKDRKLFEAQEPKRLLEIIKEKQQKLKEQEEQLNVVLPELELKRKLSNEEQEGTIYKGKKGLKSIFEDILTEKKELLVFGASGNFREILKAYFIHFHDRRAKLKIPLKIIFGEKLRNDTRNKELKLSKIKYLPKENIIPSTTFVYSNKTAIINWSVEPMIFLMKSKNVAKSYKNFFEILWNNAIQ